MTTNLTPLQCPSCGGLLRSLDPQVWQCAYCESRYVLLGEETPGLTRVVDEKDPWAGVIMCSPDEAKALQAAWPMHVGDAGPERVVIPTRVEYCPPPRPKERLRQSLLR